MESKLIRTFTNNVNELISSEQERDSLFEALKKYQGSSDVIRLVNDLKRLINDPTKLEIYDTIRKSKPKRPLIKRLHAQYSWVTRMERPLIRPQHQQHYDKLAPKAPGQRLRVIKLRRRTTESFGFAVRGGFEHGVGIFVSHVEASSQAEQKGLKMGDEIVRVNGFTIGQAIHEEVLNLIKGRDEIELKVTNIGMVPIKQNPSDPVTWQYVDKPGVNKSQVSNSPDSGQENLVKIFINLHGAPGLGCSIISGPSHFPGIFIESVRPGSLGEDYHLEVGDQIMEVNGKSFEKIKHKEAIVELKGSKELNIVIKKAVGLPLLNLKKKNVGGSPTLVKKETRKEPQPLPQEEDSEILEEDLYAKAELKHWEEEQERLKKQKAEEVIKEQFRQHELQKQLEEERREREKQERREDDIRRQEAEQIRKVEEQHRQLEELRIQQEEMAREDEKTKEAERKKEEKRKKEETARRQEQEEERKRKEITIKKQQSAVLAGRSGPSNSMKPTLLGAAPGAQTSFGTDDKEKEVIVVMEENIPLDIELEGGTDSPLGGKIVISEVFPGGAVDKNGEMKKGDQILKVNGESLENISLADANEKLWQIEQECLPGDGIKFVVVESGLNHDDEITFF